MIDLGFQPAAKVWPHEVVEGKLFTSSYDGTLNVWHVGTLEGDGTLNKFNPNNANNNNLTRTQNNNDKGGKVKDKDKMGEVEKLSGVGNNTVAPIEDANKEDPNKIIID
ncbi:hypothetical protein PoB_001606500 [Plakobranchus ocellatus]|uniref:Uncharacterized protein n=1 Tax=Plakobranchus ocellatus TaxID=259542 RepID=A0AAV3Z4L6_9GAST|nr:hypothetical protein PoB_001606500 [Plakobranchus ocellatus]